MSDRPTPCPQCGAEVHCHSECHWDCEQRIDELETVMRDLLDDFPDGYIARKLNPLRIAETGVADSIGYRSRIDELEAALRECRDEAQVIGVVGVTIEHIANGALEGDDE